MKATRAIRIPGFIGRSLVVGIGYAATSLLVGGIPTIAGLSHPGANNGFEQLPVLIGQGSLIGLALGALALQLKTSYWRHVSIWTSVVFFNSLSYAIEGMFYAPTRVIAPLPWVVVERLLIAASTGVLVTRLFSSLPEPAGRQAFPLPRSWFSLTWRLVVSAFSYLASYFVYGAINYALVTRLYYESHTGGLVVPSPTTILAAESVRAPMIVLSVLPLLLSIQWPLRKRVITVGLVLFVIGGIVPLLGTIDSLPLFLLVASGWEIFFQNVTTGIITALLFGNDKANASPALSQALPDAA